MVNKTIISTNMLGNISSLYLFREYHHRMMLMLENQEIRIIYSTTIY